MAVDSDPILLPKLPKGKEFEEFISGFLQAAGHYLDRNIIDRGVEELLELDIIATDYDGLPEPKLIEIKSGGWSFADVFKILGWMTYVDIPKGGFIVMEERKNHEFFRSKAEELNIDLIAISEIGKTEEFLKPLLRGKKINRIDIEVLRYSYWLERKILGQIKEWKKADRTKKCYEVLDHYYFKINSGIFFTPNIIDRIQALYDNFMKNGRLSAKAGHELIGEDFSGDHTQIPYKVFKETFYDCEFNLVQVSTFLEYLSKIAILKCAVDYLLLKPSDTKGKTSVKIEHFGGITKLDFLPHSFNNGLEELSKHKCYNRYPVFWQWFLYVFGGFILLDHKEKEYALLSEKTGVDISEIDNALSAMDILFPVENGWLMENKKTNILEAKFFPIPFRGIGANYRRMMYADPEKEDRAEFEDLKGLKNSYTFNDLIKWNNLAVNVFRL